MFSKTVAQPNNTDQNTFHPPEFQSNITNTPAAKFNAMVIMCNPSPYLVAVARQANQASLAFLMALHHVL
jgi:hypothetical protein